MSRILFRTGAGLALVVLFFPAGAAGQAVILKKKFVEAHRNRATMTIQFWVDDYSAIHSQDADGDIHIGGRSSQAGLPLVAEINNARMVKPAVQIVRDNKTKKIPLAGVWRLWFEHPPAAGEQQVQKKTLPDPVTSNTPHVFEIHPVTKVGTTAPGDVARTTFAAIPGYEPHEAEKAFQTYENRELTVKANNTTVALISKTTKLNYARFGIRLRAKRWKPVDGELVLADVLDEEGNPIQTREPIRMVFVKGTDPYDLIKTKSAGDVLQVIGIPRVNLDKVFAAMPVATQPRTMPIPYEMVILAVLPEN